MPAGEFEELATILLEKARDDPQCAQHDFVGQFYTQTCKAQKPLSAGCGEGSQGLPVLAPC